MIVSFAGKAGAGKDTAARILMERFGFERVALADPIKRVCKELFQFADDQLWGPSERRNEPDSRYPREDSACLTSREACQVLGTEFGRRCYPDIWVDYLLRTYELLSKGGYRYCASEGLTPFDGYQCTDVVVTDVRFVNEIRKLRSHGPVILIVRPGVSLEGNVGKHVSEVQLDGLPDKFFDAKVVNDGSVAALKREVLKLYNKLVQKG
jgi:hypothetical protein